MTKRIVIDTNIAFSAFLNVNSKIAQIIFNGTRYYNFYAPEYIRYELIEHKERIKSIGKLSEDRFIELYGLILRDIHLLNQLIIPQSCYEFALNLCADVDIDDTPFVAANDYIKGWLWSGDMKLLNGLREKGYKRIITIGDLHSDFLLKENKH